MVCDFLSIRGMLIYNVTNIVFSLLVSSKTLLPIKVSKAAAEQHLVRLEWEQSAMEEDSICSEL